MGSVYASTGLKITNSSTTGHVWTATDAVGNGSWQVAAAGGITRSVNSIAVNTTAGATALTDYVYRCTAVLTLTLPAASGNTNRYSVKNRSAGNVTVAGTVDGQTNAIIYPDDALEFISNGTDWDVF